MGFDCISDATVEESVAVIHTTNNDAAYLREALSSVFAQERHPDEVIVVDDGSKWFLPSPTGNAGPDVGPSAGTPHDDPRHAGLALADRHSHRDEHRQCDSPKCDPRGLRR